MHLVTMSRFVQAGINSEVQRPDLVRSGKLAKNVTRKAATVHLCRPERLTAEFSSA